MKLWKGALGALIGVVPGLLLFLVGVFVIEGEWQLTIAVFGLMLGISGGIGGLVVGVYHRAGTPSRIL